MQEAFISYETVRRGMASINVSRGASSFVIHDDEDPRLSHAPRGGSISLAPWAISSVPSHLWKADPIPFAYMSPATQTPFLFELHLTLERPDPSPQGILPRRSRFPSQRPPSSRAFCSKGSNFSALFFPHKASWDPDSHFKMSITSFRSWFPTPNVLPLEVPFPSLRWTLAQLTPFRFLKVLLSVTRTWAPQE